MLAIQVRLVHGTYRAASADDIASTGNDDPGEWPPSPGRLLSALVAADGTGVRCRVTDGSELDQLCQAPPPLIVASPDHSTPRSLVNSRYIVVNERVVGGVQEYPGRAALEARQSPRRSPEHPVVVYVWPDLELSEGALAALRSRAARVGYLGCADSPAVVTVGCDVPERRPGTVEWRPADDGGHGVDLPVPFPGYVEVLDEMFAQFSDGRPVRRSWFAARRVTYSWGTEAARPSVAALRLLAPMSGRRALVITSTFRDAVLSRYSELWQEPAPPVLTGHGFEANGYEQAVYLALPHVGRHGTGRLLGVAVALPASAPPEQERRTRAAVMAVLAKGLWLPGGRRVELGTVDDPAAPLTAQPKHWARRSTCWVSVLPVVHERWSKHREADLADVAGWCANAGVPAPVRARTGPLPFVPGAVALRPEDTRRPGGERRPYSHLVVELSEAAAGPVVLGRMRGFGLGLMAPLPLDRAADLLEAK